jgi:hypothetical protein
MKTLLKLEPWLFLLLVLLSAWPVLSIRYYPTLDGPAHEYNAQLIRFMLGGKGDLLGQYFSFNHEPTPNWIGHALLLVYNSFLPAWLAEKALLLTYFIGLPFTFRYLVRSLAPEKTGLCYLILPFVQTYFLILGFYNFCLALVFLFLGTGFYIRLGNSPSRGKLVLMFFIITCTYFSHLFIFIVLLMALGLIVLVQAIAAHGDDLRAIARQVFKKAILLLGLAALPLLLFVFYYFRHLTGTEKTFLPKRELLDMIKHCRPLITFGFNDQVGLSTKSFYVVFGLFFLSLFLRFEAWRKMKTFREKLLALSHPGDSWLILTAILSVLFCILPDSDGQGGYAQAGFISMRLCLLIYLAIIAWLCHQNLPRWLIIFAVVFSSYYHYHSVVYHYQQQEPLSSIAEECHKASEKIQPNSLVLPVFSCSNWLLMHFSNYLGHEKPMVLLENYEATSNYFPLYTPKTKCPDSQLGSSPSEKCDFWWHNPTGKLKKIDYVFVMGKEEDLSDSCTIRFHARLDADYTLIFKGGISKLYKLK